MRKYPLKWNYLFQTSGKLYWHTWREIGAQVVPANRCRPQEPGTVCFSENGSPRYLCPQGQIVLIKKVDDSLSWHQPRCTQFANITVVWSNPLTPYPFKSIYKNQKLKINLIIVDRILMLSIPMKMRQTHWKFKCSLIVPKTISAWWYYLSGTSIHMNIFISNIVGDDNKCLGGPDLDGLQAQMESRCKSIYLSWKLKPTI